MMGIWGASGIGKSTIARALYNSIADNFEGLCFLSDVRKRSKEPNGLSHLQETLLSKLVMEKDLNFGDYHEGIPIIQCRLSQKKILLILDDVDDMDQLKALAGSCNWFGCGSRIIITTKDKQLLKSHGIESIYNVKGLNSKESLKLLSWESGEKQIFLDLTCFFNGEKLANIINILLCVRTIDPTYAIERLIDKSLIKIEQARVTMHDLIEDVGKEIVQQESSNELGEQSRLWFYQDILHVLEQDTGTNKVEVIILDLPERIEVQWSGEELKKMKNLKMLVIRNASFSDSPKYLPNSLSSCELIQPFDKKSPNLSNCKFLQQIPDLSGVSNLIELWLDDCTNLIEIHDSVGCLHKLRELSAMRCKKLKIFPSHLRLPSLEHLNLFGCSSLQTFPEMSIVMKEMQTLDLDKTTITELPSSVRYLIGLESLSMKECPNLKQLPASICTLPNLWKLTTDSCQGLSHFKMCEGGDEASLYCSAMSLKMEQLCFSNCNLSDDSLAFCLSHFTNMILLDLSFNNFTILPECIKE
ncbi:hypothetical protein K1719_001536 [Acacia pycnantha]|nr:hypothetical protein K1719_001536 [Acacia pycnantha]